MNKELEAAVGAKAPHFRLSVQRTKLIWIGPAAHAWASGLQRELLHVY